MLTAHTLCFSTTPSSLVFSSSSSYPVCELSPSTLSHFPLVAISRYFITAQRVCTRFITAAALWQYVSAVLPASIAIQISADRATNSVAAYDEERRGIEETTEVCDRCVKVERKPIN